MDLDVDDDDEVVQEPQAVVVDVEVDVKVLDVVELGSDHDPQVPVVVVKPEADCILVVVLDTGLVDTGVASPQV